MPLHPAIAAGRTAVITGGASGLALVARVLQRIYAPKTDRRR